MFDDTGKQENLARNNMISYVKSPRQEVEYSYESRKQLFTKAMCHSYS